jgi:predicted nuclease with TOPRIM domain
MIPAMDDYEVVAQELSTLGEKLRELEQRVAEVEKVNARLEEAALTTARGLREVSHHWDMVYEAMRRPETPDADTSSARDDAAARARRRGASSS